MDRIWEEASGSIQYREESLGGFRVTTTYHGSGRFLFQTHDGVTQTTHHIHREQMKMIARMAAIAVGGDFNDVDEDADSEVMGNPREES